MSVTINRRKFFSNTAISAAGLMLGAKIADLGLEDHPDSSSYNIMKEAMKYRKIDSHTHVYLSPASTPEVQLDFADRLGIEKLVISRPVTKQDGPHQEFRDSNDMMIKAMKQYPDRFIAQFTSNPKYTKESLEEIKRCVDQGMVGLKVYYQFKINDPLFYLIIEKMIDLKMVILMHSFSGLGRGDTGPNMVIFTRTSRSRKTLLKLPGDIRKHCSSLHILPGAVTKQLLRSGNAKRILGL